MDSKTGNMDKILEGALYTVPIDQNQNQNQKVYFSLIHGRFITELQASSIFLREKVLTKGVHQCNRCLRWYRTKKDLKAHLSLVKREHSLPFPTRWVWLLNGRILRFAHEFDEVGVPDQGGQEGGYGLEGGAWQEGVAAQEVLEGHLDFIPEGAQRVRVMIINQQCVLGEYPQIGEFL